MNPHLPWEAEIVERVQESPTIFTLRLRLVDEEARKAYRFAPGQFNMVYLYGIGEVPISIASDPQDTSLLGHTIRAVGRVTEGLSRLGAGERLGLRGPYGRGWPLAAASGVVPPAALVEPFASALPCAARIWRAWLTGLEWNNI